MKYIFASEDAWLVWWFASGQYDLVYEALTSIGWKGSVVPGVCKKGTHNGSQAQPSYNLGTIFHIRSYPFIYIKIFY